MTAPALSRIGFALLLSLALGAVGGCGGGGGSSSPPPPVEQTLGPAGGSVSSSDGKVTVSVGPNALQAPAVVSIEPGTADAATAADPALVPGTTYAYTAPDIQVPDQVLIEIESAAALAAGVDGRKHALSLPIGWMPPPTCLVNGQLGSGQVAQTIFVSGPDCPSSPAPACIKVYGTATHAFCAPASEIIIVPGGNLTPCPEEYREVTGDPAFADLASLHAGQRICHRQTITSPPRLGQAGALSNLNCVTSRGKFLCPATKLPVGSYSVLWDRTLPPVPDFDVKGSSGGTGVFMEEIGPGSVVNFRIKADDPEGLGAVELVERIDNPDSGQNGAPAFVTQQRWHADPALFSGVPLKHYDSQTFQLPYLQGDPAKRHFFARVYDRAGNSALAYNNLIVQSYISTITIDSFTVTPASVQLPGGPVTIAWSVRGAAAASIDQGVGAIAVTEATALPSTGSRVVDVAAGTTFTLTATHPTRNTRLAVASVTLGADTTAPTVSLAAGPAIVVAPGTTTLTATASDMVGVTQVEFYRGATLLGTDTTTPYTQSVAFTAADIGSVAFTARAYDAAGNNATSAVVSVSVGADVTPPSVSLLASPATVLVPGSTTLQATASDAIGVTQVEFHRNGVLIATDTTAPFQQSVSFTAADVGSVSFTAKAFDAQGNNATSAPAIVTVSTPTSGDTYAGPSGIDAGNTTCAQATPCASIAKAASLAQANKTVWLQDGTYTQATQPALIDIPAGLTVRALTPGMAVLQQSLVLQGSATVVGIVLDRGPGNNYGTSIQASSGNVTLDGLKFTGLLSTASPPLAIGGSAIVTLSPGNVADYTGTLTGGAGGGNIFAMLTGNAQLTINGGSLGGSGLGGGSAFGFAAGDAAFQLQGNSRLAINNATVSINTNGIYLNGAATQLSISNSTLTSIAMQGIGRGINVASGTPVVTLVGTTVSGFVYGGGSAALGIGLSSQAGPNATVSLTDVVLSGSSIGLIVENGATATTVTITGSNLAVKNNYFGGLVCFAACAVDLTGGEASGNGTTIPGLAGGYGFYGGIWQGATDKIYSAKLRNVSVINNTSLSTGNTNTADNSGITLAGNAASSYDLGTLASPGGNVFTGNTTGNQTSGINVRAAAGVTVAAAGNTFIASVQGANGAGKYALGTSPCGASTCTVTSGAGANYRVTSGALVLAP
ncbi:MAG: Ig-like domain-containing protein [Caldimonas sp.]